METRLHNIMKEMKLPKRSVSNKTRLIERRESKITKRLKEHYQDIRDLDLFPKEELVEFAEKVIEKVILDGVAEIELVNLYTEINPIGRLVLVFETEDFDFGLNEQVSIELPSNGSFRALMSPKNINRLAKELEDLYLKDTENY